MLNPATWQITAGSDNSWRPKQICVSRCSNALSGRPLLKLKWRSKTIQSHRHHFVSVSWLSHFTWSFLVSGTSMQGKWYANRIKSKRQIVLRPCVACISGRTHYYPHWRHITSLCTYMIDIRKVDKSKFKTSFISWSPVECGLQAAFWSCSAERPIQGQPWQ